MATTAMDKQFAKTQWAHTYANAPVAIFQKIRTIAQAVNTILRIPLAVASEMVFFW